MNSNNLFIMKDEEKQALQNIDCVYKQFTMRMQIS
jgi:hypothetical protein